MKKMNFKYIDIYIITLEGKMITPSPDIRVKHSTIHLISDSLL